jgi:hypothetical protein
MPSSRHHTEWLSLIEVSGPFLSVPVLERVFPQGLDAHDPDHVRVLRLPSDEWEDDRDSESPRPAIHREWIPFVLKATLGLPVRCWQNDRTFSSGPGQRSQAQENEKAREIAAPAAVWVRYDG